MELPFHYDYFGDRRRNVGAENAGRVVFQANLLRHLRDYMDPFAVSVAEFRKTYRMPQHLVFELCQIIDPHMPVHYNQGNYVPTEIKVLCALGFFASGSYQKVLGKMADLSISQASVSNAISQVTKAFNHDEILARFIRFPATHEEREFLIARNERLGMPRVLGFIDGTLIKIVPPPRRLNMEVYYCRKGYTALNVQITCDADLYIMDINSRFPGSSNDPYIYRTSGVRAAMQATYRETRCWLLGDSIYPHEPWMQIPLPHAAPQTPEYYYTKLHCHCRNACERCIGLLKARWRCCLQDRALHYRPVKAGRIINACAVLHNFCLLRHLENPRPALDAQEPDHLQDVNEEEEVVVEEGRVQLERQALAERQFLIDFAYARRQQH